MRLLAAIVLCSPICTFAQGDPPRDVDQALRARVGEFFGDLQSGSFRKAEALVAEDTKDYYFAQQKSRVEAFTIGKITYSDNFAKAMVVVSTKRKVLFGPGFPPSVIDEPWNTTWKIEDGKWVWYYDAASVRNVTPMGPSNVKPVPQQDGPLPDLSDKAIKERAQAILKQASGLDKTQVSLSSSQDSSEKVTFHNGQTGFVRVFLSSDPTPEGFAATIDGDKVKGGENAVITLHYEPGKTPPPQKVLVKLTVQPFFRILPITVTFDK